MWARTDIDSDVIAELFPEDPTGSIYSGFRIYEIKGPFETFISTGWTVNAEGEFAPPSLQFFVDQLMMITANQRWQKQQVTEVEHNGGIFVTDTATRANISQNIQVAERVERRAPGAFKSNWKTPGGFVVLDAEDIETVGLKLAAAVQDQFNKEADVNELTLAADDTPEAKLAAWQDAMEAAWPTPVFDTLAAEPEPEPTTEPTP